MVWMDRGGVWLHRVLRAGGQAQHTLNRNTLATSKAQCKHTAPPHLSVKQPSLVELAVGEQADVGVHAVLHLQHVDRVAGGLGGWMHGWMDGWMVSCGICGVRELL